MASANLVMAPAVVAAIRAEAFRSWRSLRRFGFEPADVRQEFTLSCISQFDRYEPARSSPATFASHTCRQRTLQIIEPALAAKRNGGVVPQSLSAPIGKNEDIRTELGDIISDDDVAVRSGRRSRPTRDLLALRLDVDRVIRGLSIELADVARLLAAGATIENLAKSLRISRSTAHRRVAQIRSAFYAAGLNRYLGARGAA